MIVSILEEFSLSFNASACLYSFLIVVQFTIGITVKARTKIALINDGILQLNFNKNKITAKHKIRTNIFKSISFIPGIEYAKINVFDIVVEIFVNKNTSATAKTRSEKNAAEKIVLIFLLKRK